MVKYQMSLTLWKFRYCILGDCLCCYVFVFRTSTGKPYHVSL